MHISNSKISKLSTRIARLSIALSLAIPGAFAAPSPEEQKATGNIEFFNNDISAQCRIEFSNRDLGFNDHQGLAACRMKWPARFQLNGMKSASKITFEGRINEKGWNCQPAAGDNGPPLYRITLKVRSDNTSSPEWFFNDLLPTAQPGQVISPNVEVIEAIRTGTIPREDYAFYLHCIRLKDGNTPN